MYFVLNISCTSSQISGSILERFCPFFPLVSENAIATAQSKYEWIPNTESLNLKRMATPYKALLQF